VSVQASLTDSRSREAFQQGFTSTVAASENRIGSIVGAFDQAVTAVLGDLVWWVNARGQNSGTSGAFQ